MFEDIYIAGGWTDVYDLISRPVGTVLTIQNKTGGLLYIWTQEELPLNENSGYVIKSMETIDIDASSLGCFVKGLGNIFIQETV